MKGNLITHVHGVLNKVEQSRYYLESIVVHMDNHVNRANTQVSSCLIRLAFFLLQVDTLSFVSIGAHFAIINIHEV